MFDIRHRVGVAASPQDVYESLTTLDGLRGWWTTDTTGDPTPGGKLEFRFGSPDRGATMEVVSTRPDENVTWRCVGGPDEWIDTRCRSTSSHNPTRPLSVRATGWREPVDFMGHCSTKWGYFLLAEAVLEGGEGTPFPGDCRSAAGVETRQGDDGRGLQGAGRSEPAAHARPAERAWRAEPHGALRGARHGASVGEQASARCSEAANLVTTVRARAREVALPQRRAHQRDRSALDQPVRPARIQALGNLKLALEGTHRGQPPFRLHDLHQGHTRARVEGAHRAGVHEAVLGHRRW